MTFALSNVSMLKIITLENHSTKCLGNENNVIIFMLGEEALTTIDSYKYCKFKLLYIIKFVELK